MLPVSASTVVKETFVGTVSGTDGDGLFGAIGASLDTTFNVSFLFNPTNGYSSGVGYLQLAGGIAVGPPSPSLGVTISISGKSVLIDGDYSSGFDIYNSQYWHPPVYTFGTTAYAVPTNNTFFHSDGINFDVQSASADVPTPTSITSPFLYVVQPGDISGGALVLGNDSLSFVPTSVMLSDITLSVPEPSTSAMLLLGFATIGLATLLHRPRIVT